MKLLPIAIALWCIPAFASPRTDLAAQMALSVTTVQSPAPAPVGNKCSECGGSGRLGDGTVSTQCPHCKGTGVEPDAAERVQAAVDEVAKPAIAAKKNVSVPRMTNSRWSIGSQSYRTASTETIARHLEQAHGISTDGMSRQSMLNAHDNAHAGASCPTGRCPR